MSENTPQELISAYFDGELTSEEQRHAERLLESDPAARRFLEDMERLQQGLREFPSHRLPAGFAQRVLKEAERRMLARPSPPANGVSPPMPPLEPHMPWIRIGLATTIAASLLITFVISSRMTPEKDASRPVAVRPPRVAPPGFDPLRDQRLDGARHADERSERQREADNGIHRYNQPKNSARFGALASHDNPAKAEGNLSTSEDVSPPAGTNLSFAAAGKENAWHQNSYVFDVANEVVQTRVLERFEEVLSQQQIALEANVDLQKKASVADSSEKAEEALGGESSQSAQTPVGVREAADQPADRVYVVEATPEQLNNTLLNLNRLAVETPVAARLRRLGENESDGSQVLANSRDTDLEAAAAQDELGAMQSARTGLPTAKAPKQARTSQADAAQSSPVQTKLGHEASGMKMAEEARQKEAAETNRSKQGRSGQVDLESSNQAEQNAARLPATAEETQRAIFIFRIAPPAVLPPVAAPTQQPAERSASPAKAN